MPYFYNFDALLHEPYTLLLSMLYFCLFLSAIWLPHDTLGHYRGDSLTHAMLITAFYQLSTRTS